MSRQDSVVEHNENVRLNKYRAINPCKIIVIGLISFFYPFGHNRSAAIYLHNTSHSARMY